MSKASQEDTKITLDNSGQKLLFSFRFLWRQPIKESRQGTDMWRWWTVAASW